MRKLQLSATGDEITELTRAADGRGEFGQIRKSTLRKLLIDQQRLLAWHRGEYVEPSAPGAEEAALATEAAKPQGSLL